MSVRETTGLPGAGTSPADPCDQIRRARDLSDKDAKRDRDRRRRVGVAVAVVAPLVVLLEAIRQQYVPIGCGALTLAAAQLVLLVIALLVAFLQLGTSHDRWITNRLRAELLRREEFLLCARVGPYLTSSDGTTPRLVQGRLLNLQSSEAELVRLVDLRDVTGRPWRDELEDADRAGTSAAVPDIGVKMQAYLDERLDKQRTYFEGASASSERSDRLCENVVRAVLLAAALIALLQLGSLWLRERGLPPPPHSWPLLAAELLSLLLPLVGASTVAIRSLFEFGRLAGSYADHGRRLGAIQVQLLQLQNEIEQRGCGDADLRFKRLVLQAEESLANELRSWWTILHLQRPTATP